MIRETFNFYVLLLYVCFPFFRWVKFCSGCFRQVFFIWDTKKVVAGRVRQVVVLYSNDCNVWEFVWAESVLVVLDEWSSYKSGRLNRFDCILTFIKNTH